MKTLAQIEARTPISSVPFTISAPGSYYLTTNLTISSGNAITVNANNVMLDLNGFTLFSTQALSLASPVAILLGGVTNITIVRGFISGGVTNNAGTYGGSGFAYGITYSIGSPTPVNARVSGVTVSGCQFVGIYLGNSSTVVEACTVNTVGNVGIGASSVSDSTALNCGNIGIDAFGVANNCSGSSSGSGAGVNAFTANNCYGISASGNGISANIATGCYGESDAGAGDGVLTYTANNCTGISDGSGYGILAYEIATACYGTSVGGVGLNTFIATGCHASSFVVAHNVNSY
jgi:hypothetical protein